MIRGHEGTIIMVDHSQFERNVPFITVKPQYAAASRSAAMPTCRVRQ
jgi:hypothetical protein